tara:strand:- start:33922 stop:34143 length:222 start_codon:yes stop_codon:yes gene_type:complete
MMKNLKKIISKIEKDIDKKIDLEKNFKDNDIDSLDLMSVISEVENEYKIRFKEKDLKKIKDFKTLEEFIIKLL